MNVGDSVRMAATVRTEYAILPEPDGDWDWVYLPDESRPDRKGLLRITLPAPCLGTVAGWTCLHTGWRGMAQDYEDTATYAYFDTDKAFKVWVIIPYSKRGQWRIPVHCLEEDLEIVS